MKKADRHSGRPCFVYQLQPHISYAAGKTFVDPQIDFYVPFMLLATAR